MAEETNPLAASTEALAKPVSAFFRSRTNKIQDALLAAVAASNLHGTALQQVNNKIQDMANTMINQVGSEIMAEADLDDAISDLSDNLIQQTILNDVAQTLAEEQLPAPMAEQALNDFGADPTGAAMTDDEQMAAALPDQDDERIKQGQELADAARSAAKNNASNPEAIEPETDLASKTPEENKTPNQNHLPNQDNERIKQGQELADTARSAAKNNASNPEAIEPETDLPPPSRFKSPVQTEPNQTETEAEQPAIENEITPPPQENDTEAKPTSETPDGNKEPEAESQAKEDQKPIENPSEEKPVPPPLPPPPPEAVVPSPDELPLTDDQGVPLVDTDEYGRPTTPTNSENSPDAEQTPDQPNPNQNPNDPASANSGTSNSPQNTPNRGRITQGINSLRNRSLLLEIEKKVNALNQDKNKLLKEIKKLKADLAPLESKKRLLQLSYWSLMTAAWVLRILAAILAMTIIFLVLIPLAEAVWLAANVPSSSAALVDMELEKIKEQMADKEKELETKNQKLKNYNQEIAKLARERSKLMNQSLLSNRAA